MVLASRESPQTAHRGHWASCRLSGWCPGWGDQTTAVAHLQGLAARWMGTAVPMTTQQVPCLSCSPGRRDIRAAGRWG